MSDIDEAPCSCPADDHTYQCLAGRLGKKLKRLTPEAKVAFVLDGAEFLAKHGR